MPLKGLRTLSIPQQPMGASSAWLGGFPEATHGRRRCGIPAGARHQPETLLPLTAILAQRSPSTGSRTEAYQVVWTRRCDWDCDSVLTRIARLGLLYGHRSSENQGGVTGSCGAIGSLAYGRGCEKCHRAVQACSPSDKIKKRLGKKCSVL